MHEAQLHNESCFLTLTYGDVAPPVSLRYADFQSFMRRLRKAFPGVRIRFFACGEYGERKARPHWHACLFGVNFPDRQKLSSSDLWQSSMLERLWGHGICRIGDLTFESAAYVARYCTKKVTGDLAEAHYRVVDPDTGEVVQREPEMARMSLRPGIGAGWLRRYVGECYNAVSAGKVVARGVECKAPRYYDKLMEDTDVLEFVKQKRIDEARLRRDDNTAARLAVREVVARAALNLKGRTL